MALRRGRPATALAGGQRGLDGRQRLGLGGDAEDPRTDCRALDVRCDRDRGRLRGVIVSGRCVSDGSGRRRGVGDSVRDGLLGGGLGRDIAGDGLGPSALVGAGGSFSRGFASGGCSGCGPLGDSLGTLRLSSGRLSSGRLRGMRLSSGRLDGMRLSSGRLRGMRLSNGRLDGMPPAGTLLSCGRLNGRCRLVSSVPVQPRLHARDRVGRGRNIVAWRIGRLRGRALPVGLQCRPAVRIGRRLG